MCTSRRLKETFLHLYGPDRGGGGRVLLQHDEGARTSMRRCLDNGPQIVKFSTFMITSDYIHKAHV